MNPLKAIGLIGNIPASDTLPALQPERLLCCVAARAKVGIPYKLGANGPSELDCSAFVQAVWRDAGIPGWGEFPVAIDWWTGKMFQHLVPVEEHEVLPGDVALYGNIVQDDKMGPLLAGGHVVMVTDMENGVVTEVIGASGGTIGQVRIIKKIDAHRYRSDFVGFRSMPGAYTPDV